MFTYTRLHLLLIQPRHIHVLTCSPQAKWRRKLKRMKAWAKGLVGRSATGGAPAAAQDSRGGSCKPTSAGQPVATSQPLHGTRAPAPLEEPPMDEACLMVQLAARARSMHAGSGLSAPTPGTGMMPDHTPSLQAFAPKLFTPSLSFTSPGLKRAVSIRGCRPGTPAVSSMDPRRVRALLQSPEGGDADSAQAGLSPRAGVLAGLLSPGPMAPPSTLPTAWRAVHAESPLAQPASGVGGRQLPLPPAKPSPTKQANAQLRNLLLASASNSAAMQALTLGLLRAYASEPSCTASACAPTTEDAACCEGLAEQVATHPSSGPSQHCQLLGRRVQSTGQTALCAPALMPRLANAVTVPADTAVTLTCAARAKEVARLARRPRDQVGCNSVLLWSHLVCMACCTASAGPAVDELLHTRGAVGKRGIVCCSHTLSFAVAAGG